MLKAQFFLLAFILLMVVIGAVSVARTYAALPPKRMPMLVPVSRSPMGKPKAFAILTVVLGIFAYAMYEQYQRSSLLVFAPFLIAFVQWKRGVLNRPEVGAETEVD